MTRRNQKGVRESMPKNDGFLRNICGDRVCYRRGLWKKGCYAFHSERPGETGKCPIRCNDPGWFKNTREEVEQYGQYRKRKKAKTLSVMPQVKSITVAERTETLC